MIQMKKVDTTNLKFNVGEVVATVDPVSVYQFAKENPEGIFYGYDGTEKAVACIGGVLWWHPTYAELHDIHMDDEDMYA